MLSPEIRRVGSGKGITFGHEGEKKLTVCVWENALAKQPVMKEPRFLEDELIQRLSLPLNLERNSHHKFHSLLSFFRKEARLRARELPVLISLDENCYGKLISNYFFATAQ